MPDTTNSLLLEVAWIYTSHGKCGASKVICWNCDECDLSATTVGHIGTIVLGRGRRGGAVEGRARNSPPACGALRSRGSPRLSLSRVVAVLPVRCYCVFPVCSDGAMNPSTLIFLCLFGVAILNQGKRFCTLFKLSYCQLCCTFFSS